MIASNSRSALISSPTTPDRNKRTPRQAEASRRNGAKSRGPKTLAGKLVSRRNALQHGFYAAALPFADTIFTDRSGFELVLAAIVEDIRPATQIEVCLCESIAVNQLRLRQIQSRIDYLLDPDQVDRRSDRWEYARRPRSPDLMILRIAVADHLLDHWAGRTDEPLSTEELDVLAAGLVAEHHAARVEIREAKEALAEVRREIKAEPPKDARDAENTADYLDIVRESVKLAKEWVQETSLLAAAAAKRESLAERLEAEGGTGSGLPARIRAFRKWAAAEVKRLAHSHEWTLDREKKEIAADHTDFGSLESLLRFDAHFRRALHRDLAAIERLRAPGSAFSAP